MNTTEVETKLKELENEKKQTLKSLDDNLGQKYPLGTVVIFDGVLCQGRFDLNPQETQWQGVVVSRFTGGYCRIYEQMTNVGHWVLYTKIKGVIE